MKRKYNTKKYLIFYLIFASYIITWQSAAVAQNLAVSGIISSAESGEVIIDADVVIDGIQTKTDTRGFYQIQGLTSGTHEMILFNYGFKTIKKSIVLKDVNHTLNFSMEPITQWLDEVAIEESPTHSFGIARLNAVDGTGIYEAKKTEVIVMDQVVGNLATNNSRQVYAKVPGLNIWESDGAGLQLGIGARGLDPNRTTNFNVRQNGYDISADALGYPENYYTPPAEAVERIEVVRGAASLQYGTQFGGLVNFKLKESPTDKPLEIILRNGIGSFGLFNTFNSIGGTIDKIKYYGFFQHKQGDGYRPNSGFNLNMGFGNVTYAVNEDLKINFQHTTMGYLAQQPGGLTDALFEQDPKQSIRERNWFRVDWHLSALNLDFRINSKLKLNMRNFILLGGRDALGNLGRIDRIDDPELARDLFVDDFQNFGNETRLIYHYNLSDNLAVLLVGARFYHGTTDRKQGIGPAGKDDHFVFKSPDNLEGSDFQFNSKNIAIFAENIFNISEKLSITPGVRFEHIITDAAGYYQDKVLVPNPVTGLAEDSVFKANEIRSNPRSFLFAGAGLSYKLNPETEIYSNFSQNYRAITFNDIRVINPNLTVDPDIHDESGYNFDIGLRGEIGNTVNFDVSAFYLKYNDRIGAVLKIDDNHRIYRYRTNISDSRHFGVEIFGELDFIKLFNQDLENEKLSLYTNISIIDTRYVSTQEEAIEGNKVELVPPFSAKAGITYVKNNLKASYQFSYTHEHFSDASNAIITPSAVEGIIPGYKVMDLSLAYEYKFITFESGINNLANEHYFTRRAAGYPGPGIIPSDGRGFYFTIQLKL